MIRLTTPSMTQFRPSRRTLLASVCALALMPRSAFALTTEQASALVDQVVTDINRVIASGKSGNSLYRDFEAIFARYADTAVIARSVLGADWRSINDAQRRSFTAAFQGYMARKYGRQFREFQGSRIEVSGATTVNRYVEVSARAIRSGRSSVDITFLIADRGGRSRFFDLRIEGISLARTERDEIGAMLDARRGNIDQLIVDLQTI